jgi:ApbE superfamily uncharacterized protein (UPF0280 family)
MAYEERKYRQAMEGDGLVSFQVMVKETDLWISACTNLEETAVKAVKETRRTLEHYILENPYFLSTMEPLDVGPAAPPLIRSMADAAKIAGVGPMAAVAGAVAEQVGRKLLEMSEEVIVENGGDLFMASSRERTVSLYAGDSPFSNRIGMRIPAEQTPVGICTSSGTVGHSVSYGKSDAVCVHSPVAALADASATAAGNLVHRGKDIQRALDFLSSLPGIRGAVIVSQGKMGVWGELELVKI